jgi:hypothetical protein
MKVHGHYHVAPPRSHIAGALQYFQKKVAAPHRSQELLASTTTTGEASITGSVKSARRFGMDGYSNPTLYSEAQQSKPRFSVKSRAPQGQKNR